MGNPDVMLHWLGIGLGSALGGMARYGISTWMSQRWGETFPWGTLWVNVSGSFLVGFIFVLTGTEGRLRLDPMWRDLILIGILGGYTTFSAFSLQTLNLLREGQWLGAAGYVVGSLSLSLAAVALGYGVAQIWGGLRA
jgi:CrcB protein